MSLSAGTRQPGAVLPRSLRGDDERARGNHPVVPRNPVRLFSNRHFMGLPGRSYDVSADGKRFLMIKDPDADQNSAARGVIFVYNWIEDLMAKLPRR